MLQARKRSQPICLDTDVCPGLQQCLKCPNIISAVLDVNVRLPARGQHWANPVPIADGCDLQWCSQTLDFDEDIWCKKVTFNLSIELKHVDQCIWRWVPGQAIPVQRDCPAIAETHTVWIDPMQTVVELRCTDDFHDEPEWLLRVFLTMDYQPCRNIGCDKVGGPDPYACLGNCLMHREMHVLAFRPINCACKLCPPIDNKWPRFEPIPEETLRCVCCGTGAPDWPCFCWVDSCSDFECFEQHGRYYCDQPNQYIEVRDMKAKA